MTDDRSVFDGAAGEGSTSLASMCQTVTTPTAITCEYGPRASPGGPYLFALALESGEIRQVRCRRLACDHCLPIQAWRRAQAMAYMQPERMVLFTSMADAGDPQPFVTARIRMKRLRQALARKGVASGQWAWTLEKNPKETGYHAHAVQWGPYIPQTRLGDAAAAAGSGITFIQATRVGTSDIANYATKGFGSVRYGLKTFREKEVAREALQINGGRIERHTREFYQYKGAPISVRKAEEYATMDPIGGDKEPIKIGTPETIMQFLHHRSNRSLLDAACRAADNLSKTCT